MTKPNLKANIASMFVLQISNYVIPLITFPYLTRVLGVTSFGLYSLAFAITAYLILVTDWGFPLIVPGQIARVREYTDEVSDIFWSTLAAKALVGGLTISVVLVAVHVIPALKQIGFILLCASGMVVANVVTVNWCLQGLERLGKVAASIAFGRIMTVPATFLFVHNQHDAWIAALVQSGGAMFGGVLSIILLARQRVIHAPSIRFGKVMSQLREAWPLFLSNISVSLYTTTNTVLLGLVQGPAQVGLFSSGDRLRAAAQGVISPISQAIFPHSSRLMHQNKEEGLRFVRSLLWRQGLFMLAISVTLELGAPLLIRILAGPGFEGAIPVLRLLAPIPFLAGLSNVLGIQLMLPLDMKKLFSRILMVPAMIDLALIVPMSLRYGALGAAATVLFAEFLVVASMLIALHRAGVSLFSHSRHAVQG